jgi:GDPmannose 4,6-dehydratase
MTNKKALITGITGQDGVYLVRFLLKKGYDIYGLVTGLPGRDNFHNFSKLSIDEKSIQKVLLDDLDKLDLENAEVYNLAAQSSVGKSWDEPALTFEVNVINYIRLLEKLKGKNVKILHAVSGEIYGDTQEIISESTPYTPNNPYANSKLASLCHGQIMRSSHGMWVTNAILFNHESPLRDDKFVIRKIINAANDIRSGKADSLELGNIEIKRDWGIAEEYVEAMWKLLQLESPVDVNIATGVTISLKELIKYIFDFYKISDFESYIKINKDFIRPTDIASIRVNPKKLNDLGISLNPINSANISKIIAI